MNAPGENLILLPFGDRLLGFTVQEFEAARERGLALAGNAATPPAVNGDAPQHLCTAEAMEERTGVPASWFLEAARAGTVPHHRLGRYVRFDLAEVRASTRFRSRSGQGECPDLDVATREPGRPPKARGEVPTPPKLRRKPQSGRAEAQEERL